MSPAAVVLALAVVATGAALRGALGARRRSILFGRLELGGRLGHTDRSAPSTSVRRLSLPAPPGWVPPRLVDAGIDVPAAAAWWGWLAVVAAGTALASIVSGVAAGLLAAAALAGLPPLALRTRRGQADVQVERHLPLALESIARSLRSGASVRQAVGEAAGVGQGNGPGQAGGAGHACVAGQGSGAGQAGRAGQASVAGHAGRAGQAGAGLAGGTSGAGGCRSLQAELAVVAAQAGHGASLVSALEALAERRPRPGVRLAVAALCLGIDTGGAQARAVDGVAATMRERLAVEAEVRALSSQARVSALVIGLAPLVFGAFAAATDPRTSQFLLHTTAGLSFVVVGLLLDGIGWLWMQRLCRVSS